MYDIQPQIELAERYLERIQQAESRDELRIIAFDLANEKVASCALYRTLLGVMKRCLRNI